MRRYFPLLLCIALAACATAPAQLASGTAQAMDPPERLVLALAQAEEADQRGDQSGLIAALDTINALGARPESESDQAKLDRWNAQRPDGAAPTRGRLLGPGYRSGRLPPGHELSLEQSFAGGQAASIAVSARGGGVIAVKVFDRGDKAICSQASATATCRWMPLFTQHHRIVLRNPGRAAVSYYIAFD